MNPKDEKKDAAEILLEAENGRVVKTSQPTCGYCGEVIEGGMDDQTAVEHMSRCTAVGTPALRAWRDILNQNR